MTSRIVLIAIPLLYLSGCGSAEETTEQLPPPPQPAVAVKPPVQEKPVFETRTDTIAAVRKSERHPGGTSRREPQIRFMVQIGAFKDPQNASQVQTTARQRYHLPVLNDYHTKLGLYQIRIGFFETREAAQTFRSQMMREFPTDYKDTWVVQLKR
jgi:cell division septation protein DedD